MDTLAGVPLLVIEDDADCLALMTELLEHAGAVVTSATNGNDALRAFASGHPSVVVSDIGLPDLDGFHLMERFRATKGRARFGGLAVTAYGSRAHFERAMRSGFDAFLRKPIDIDRLLQVVTRLASEQGASDA